MKTKIFSLLIVSILMITPVFAQSVWTEEPETRFSVRAGFDLQNIVGQNAAGNDFNGDLRPAFHFGFLADVPIATDFYVQPGLLWNSKGTIQETSSFTGETVTTKIRTHYLELPINLLYKPILGNGRIIVGFGPYLAYGIAGNAESEGGGQNQINDVEFESDVNQASQNVIYFKPWDAGANFVVGYEMANNITLQLNAQLGLAEINPNYEGVSGDESSLKNIGFGLSVGYQF